MSRANFLFPSHYSTDFNLKFRTGILADPSAFEEPLLSTAISIILNEKNQLFAVSQSGPGLNDDALAKANSQDVLAQCIEAAKSRRSEISEVIDQAT